MKALATVAVVGFAYGSEDNELWRSQHPSNNSTVHKPQVHYFHRPVFVPKPQDNHLLSHADMSTAEPAISHKNHQERPRFWSRPEIRQWLHKYLRRNVTHTQSPPHHDNNLRRRLFAEEDDELYSPIYKDSFLDSSVYPNDRINPKLYPNWPWKQTVYADEDNELFADEDDELFIDQDEELFTLNKNTTHKPTPNKPSRKPAMDPYPRPFKPAIWHDPAIYNRHKNVSHVPHHRNATHVPHHKNHTQHLPHTQLKNHLLQKGRLDIHHHKNATQIPHQHHQVAHNRTRPFFPAPHHNRTIPKNVVAHDDEEFFAVEDNELMFHVERSRNTRYADDLDDELFAAEDNELMFYAEGKGKGKPQKKPTYVDDLEDDELKGNFFKGVGNFVKQHGPTILKVGGMIAGLDDDLDNTLFDLQKLLADASKTVVDVKQKDKNYGELLNDAINIAKDLKRKDDLEDSELARHQGSRYNYRKDN